MKSCALNQVVTASVAPPRVGLLSTVGALIVALLTFATAASHADERVEGVVCWHMEA